MKTWFVILPALLGMAGAAVAETPAWVPIEVELRHPGVDPEAPRTYVLHQHRDGDGWITGYSLVVDSVICKEVVCEVVAVTMSWDALGRFERYELEEGSSLEKVKGMGAESYKAVPFARADYRKLDAILADPYSELGNRKLDGMTRSSGDEDVDLVSSPTPVNLKGAVVEGASLTCFHLWHWAHGDVGPTARELTRSTANDALLENFLASEKPAYVHFALEQLELGRKFTTEWSERVSGRMQEWEDAATLDRGLDFLQKALPEEARFFRQLGLLFASCRPQGRIRVLDHLQSREELPAALLEKVSETLPAVEDFYELQLLLKLLEDHDHRSPAVLARVSGLLESENFFIARRAYTHLQGRALDAPTARLVEGFREKSRKEGRVLPNRRTP